MSDSHCSPVNMMLHVNCPLVVISHSRVSLPFAHAVGEPGSVQAQRVVTAANGVTLMLIALMSVFSSLYTRPHCPIITPPPTTTAHCVSIFSACVPHWHTICVCVRVSVHTWAGMHVQCVTAWPSVDVHWFRRIPFAFCCASAACSLTFGCARHETCEN